MITLKARCIVEGKSGQGQVLFSSQPIPFLGAVDPEKGCVSDSKHEIFGMPFRNKILVFPNSVGSSVGAYVIYKLKKAHKAPKAIINQESDIITASGCAIAGITLLDLVEDSIVLLKQKKRVCIIPKKWEVSFDE